MSRVAGVEIRTDMSNAERRLVLTEWKDKCEKALTDDATSADDFFTAAIGWALMSDKLKEIEKCEPLKP